MKKFLALSVFFLSSSVSNAQVQKELFDFEYNGVVLNGLLNMPEDKDPKGIVLVVHGSGQTNAVSQEWYRDVREQLVKSGYATYMWDKMGCGKSGGIFDYNQTVQSSAEEVVAAIKTLKEKQVPGAEDIGLWGISRAGWINPLVINQYDGIRFWISVSGVDAKENFKYLLTENLRINGHPKDTIDLLVNEWQEATKITHAGGSYEACQAATQNLSQNKFWKRFSNVEMTEQDYYAYQKGFMEQELDEASGLQVHVPGFENMLSNIDCPVLALFGEKDMNVDWTKTKSLYENTLGQNTDLTIRSFRDCNHNMYKCETGGFYEFEDNDLAWDRCDDFLNVMAHWLDERK